VRGALIRCDFRVLGCAEVLCVCVAVCCSVCCKVYWSVLECVEVCLSVLGVHCSVNTLSSATMRGGSACV